MSCFVDPTSFLDARHLCFSAPPASTARRHSSHPPTQVRNQITAAGGARWPWPMPQQPKKHVRLPCCRLRDTREQVDVRLRPDDTASRLLDLSLVFFSSLVGLSLTSSTVLPGRVCVPLPISGNKTVKCCLPCPQTDWVYPDSKRLLSRLFSCASGELRVILTRRGRLLCSYSSRQLSQCHRLGLLSRLAVDFCCASRRQNTTALHDHMLSPCNNSDGGTASVRVRRGRRRKRALLANRVTFQLGFIIPLGAKPKQCYNDITPHDMFSDTTCALSGTSLLVGGWCAVMWGKLPKFCVLRLCIAGVSDAIFAQFLSGPFRCICRYVGRWSLGRSTLLAPSWLVGVSRSSSLPFLSLPLASRTASETPATSTTPRLSRCFGSLC